jgi:plastocyanin
MFGSNLQRRGVLAAAALALAMAATTAARADDAAVTIDNFTFTPATLTVKPGTRVVWTNNDDMPHTVVSALSPPLFKSKALDTDDSFSSVFDKPGTYPYFCGLHPHMQGTIVVK